MTATATKPRRAAAKPKAAPAPAFGLTSAQNWHEITVPHDKSQHVELVQHIAYDTSGAWHAQPLMRARLGMDAWNLINFAAQEEFNDRLRAQKMPSSEWQVGAPQKIDKMLAIELCVLMWATGHATSAAQISAIVVAWLVMRPQERWWLYSMAAAQGALAADKDRGWRKALFFALADKALVVEGGAQ